MPHSPRTPTRPRLSSGADLSPSSSANPQYENHNNNSSRPLPNHRNSLYSIPSLSPSTSQPPSSHGRQGSFGMVNGLGSAPDQDSGLGNLADELAEAWDDDGRSELEEGGLGTQVDGPDTVHDGRIDLSTGSEDSSNLHITTELAASPSWGRNPSNSSSSPIKRRSRPKQHRQFSSYGNTDYGDGFELEVDKDSPLSVRMAAIESLARQTLESNGSAPDPIIQRVANSLKDLGSQSSLENGATR